MPVSSHLYELVKSLDKGEKRYIRLCSKFQNGDKNYMRLFDLLEKQKKYDEISIKEKLKVNDFSFIKNYLYEYILNCLRSYKSNDKRKPDQKIHDLITDTISLEDRGLYSQARKRVNKAEKLALKYHRFHYLILIVRKKLSYLFSNDTRKLREQFEVLLEQARFITNEIMIETQVLNFYYQATVFERTKNYTNEEVDTLKNNWELFVDKNKDIKVSSFYTKWLSECINSTLAQFKGDNQKRYECYQKVIFIWDSYPELIKIEPHSYIIVLSNYLNCCFALKKWGDFPAQINKIKSISSRNFNEEAENFQTYAFHELLYLLNTRDLSNALSSLSIIKDGLNIYRSKINKSRELSFYYNISILYFLLDRISEAHSWLDKILQQNRNDHRKDLQRFAEILQLFYHFELGNIQLVFNLISIVRRKLQNKKRLSKFEHMALKGLGSIIAVPTKEDQILLICELQKSLKIEQKKGDLLGLDEILLWTEKALNK